jgi:hypothetical protein
MVAGPLSDRALVEVFHLTFVRLLAAGPGKEKFVIKGGANMRFFFGSPRYSEDIAFDVAPGEPHQLRDRVAKTLASPAMQNTLQSYGIAIARTSAPKQTETTQRWKIGLRAESRAQELPTRIEFSHRGLTGEARLQPVDRAVAAAYAMTPPLASHYLLPAALRQKVGALAQRAETQARDLFDLDLLLARAGGTLAAAGSTRSLLSRAEERALGLSYDEFAGQVLAYLDPVERAPLASRKAWEAMQLRVATALAEARP